MTFFHRAAALLFPPHKVLAWWIRRLTVEHKIEWVTRKTEPSLTPSDLVVVCIVRNGSTQLQSFIDHYVRLGAAHIVFLDNGSTDNTLLLAGGAMGPITLLKCDLPFQLYESVLKRWLAEKFGKDCWCLIADIDERLVYPGSDQIKLHEFLQYLNQKGFTGVLTQMVDLFSDSALPDWPSGKDIESSSVWYDHSDLTGYAPWFLEKIINHNRYSSDRTVFFTGGIRNKIFGVNRLLTKQALIFGPKNVRLVTPHWSRNGYYADVSCALLHYSFEQGYYEKCLDVVQRNSQWKNSREYRISLEKIRASAGLLQLKLPSAKRLGSVDQLVEEGFLFVSVDYLNYADRIRNVSGNRDEQHRD